MKSIKSYLLCIFFLGGCTTLKQQIAVNEATPVKPVDSLPEPYATKSVMHFSNVVGWNKTEMPVAPEGFAVSRYAESLQNPRWMYVLPNGDVLVAESNTEHGLLEKAGAVIIGASKSNDMRKSANRITILRDTDKDGKPDVREVFLSGLNQPFGMLLLKNKLYVANTDALWKFPYEKGQLKINAAGEKIIDLPAGKNNRHWTRNIIANGKGSKIYIAIGSGSNVAENGLEEDKDKARIWEINPDGSGLKVYASGLRNPVGMDWAPGTQTLWTAVNERDELGDNLVPDYITSVKSGGFYGWPYAYFGQHIDPRIEAKDQRPDLVEKGIVPDVALGSHTASLGLLFYTGKQFPAKYRNGAFIAQHGSWNRSVLAGYKVIFIPFENGKPAGKEEDFLTGFIIEPEGKKVHGRPVGLAMLPDGSLLVTDDTSDTIWRVSVEDAKSTKAQKARTKLAYRQAGLSAGADKFQVPSRIPHVRDEIRRRLAAVSYQQLATVHSLLTSHLSPPPSQKARKTCCWRYQQ